MMSSRTAAVDGYLRKNKRWEGELSALRRIILEGPLVEQVKWRAPCYTLEGKNVVMLGAFKAWCVLSFLKGALLSDAHGLLVKPGENTQAARVIRFTDVRQVEEREAILKAYLDEAVAVERAGLAVTFKGISEFSVPEEFQEQLDGRAALKIAFDALTPGRQRAYLLYFSSARQSRTRAARVHKCMASILQGKGLDD